MSIPKKQYKKYIQDCLGSIKCNEDDIELLIKALELEDEMLKRCFIESSHHIRNAFLSAIYQVRENNKEIYKRTLLLKESE